MHVCLDPFYTVMGQDFWTCSRRKPPKEIYIKMFLWMHFEAKATKIKLQNIYKRNKFLWILRRSNQCHLLQREAVGWDTEQLQDWITHLSAGYLRLVNYLVNTKLLKIKNCMAEYALFMVWLAHWGLYRHWILPGPGAYQALGPTMPWGLPGPWAYHALGPTRHWGIPGPGAYQALGPTRPWGLPCPEAYQDLGPTRLWPLGPTMAIRHWSLPGLPGNGLFRKFLLFLLTVRWSSFPCNKGCFYCW